MSEYIEVGQPLQFTDPNTPTRAGEIVENVSDIYNIPSPRLGMQVFVKSEKKTYTITGLKEAVIGGERVPDAKVDTFEAVKSQVEEINNDFAEMQEALINGSFVVGIAKAVKAGAVTFEMLDGKLQLSASVVDDLETDDALKPLSANQGKVLKELIDIINGTGEGSTDKKITDAIAKLVDNAPENLDTLKKLAEWIKDHGTEVAEMLAAINANATAIKTEAERATEAESDIKATAISKEAFEAFATSSTLELGCKTLAGEEFMVELPAATTENAGVMSAEDKKALDGKDTVKVQSVVFESTYQWQKLETPIKAGSIIELSGAGMSLNFYKERNDSEPNYLIKERGVAEVDFTYVRNLEKVGEFHVKATLKSKIGELASEIELVDTKIKTIEDALELQPLKDVTLYPAGDNLFFHYTKEDYTDSTMDTYISGEHYIAVEGGKDIFVSGNGYNINAKMYDADYKALNTKQISKNTVFTLPDNCSFIKWVVAVNDLVNKSPIMISYGKESKPYSIFTIDLTGELSNEINEIKTDLSKIAIKADGEDIITGYNVEFTGQYQWIKLNTPIKAGSVIELSGAGTKLNFYETKSATANLVDIKGIANAEYTYVRNLSVTGSFSIKATEKGKISIIHEEIEKIKDDVDTLLEPKSEFILTEPTAVVLSSTSEHCLYLDDAVVGDTAGMKYGLTNTQFVSYGSIAYVNKPVVGTKKGVFLGISATDKVRKELYVKSVAPAPRLINILDIGSSYIDIGTVTERQYNNYTRDGYTVNLLGTMGHPGKRHEARSGGTWDFLVKPLGRAVILDVGGVTSLPTTGYPGTTYQDVNGIKWTVRGIVINDGVGKLVLSSFSVDTNYGGEAASGNTDYDVAAVNMPSAGTLIKTTNDSTGTSTTDGDDIIQYSSKELVYYNPFWNPVTNELDFAYYINKWGFANPDIITLTFGSNDLGNFAEASQELVDEVVGKAVSASDRIHEQLPNCKVLITCSCYGYKGVGENNFREVFRIKNIQKYYKTLVGRMGQSTAYGDYVRVVPTMCMIDRENGYNISEKTLHSSYPAIKYARDIVHPNTNGFNQFADAMLGYAYDLLGE